MIMCVNKCKQRIQNGLEEKRWLQKETERQISVCVKVSAKAPQIFRTGKVEMRAEIIARERGNGGIKSERNFGKGRNDLDSFLEISGFQERQGDNYSFWKQCYSENLRTEEASLFEGRGWVNKQREI